MTEKSLEIMAPYGFHARPALKICEMVKEYSGDVYMIHEDKIADMKNIIKILALDVKKGSRVTIQVSGEGEEKMAERLVEFILNIAD